MVKTTMYEAPSMTEYELLSEQAFLNGSNGATTESFYPQSLYDEGNNNWQ